VGITQHNASSKIAKIYHVIQIKLNEFKENGNIHMSNDLTNKAYLSTITVTNIYQSFTNKMAAKINWNRYGTKLHQCHTMYINNL